MNRPAPGQYRPNDRTDHGDRRDPAHGEDARRPVGSAAGRPPVPVDEVMDALQALASRTRSGMPPPSVADDPFPPRSGSSAPRRSVAPAMAPDPDDTAAEWNESASPARRWPAWGSVAVIVASAAALAVLLLGALSLWRQMSHSEPPVQTGIAAPSAAAPIPVPMPNPAGTADLATIEKALNTCDDDAARNPDALLFVILPLTSPTKNYQPWIAASVGEIGTSVILLRSRDALDGLRQGTLTLYNGVFTFSIIDAATEATHAWSAASGVVRLEKPDASDLTGFRVRFGFADFVGDTPSNFRFPRQKGVCYWVSALLRP